MKKNIFQKKCLHLLNGSPKEVSEFSYRDFLQCYEENILFGEDQQSLLQQCMMQRHQTFLMDCKKTVIAAPRGEGKTTLVSQGLLLWSLITGLKHYGCLIMASKEQSINLIEAAKNILKNRKDVFQQYNIDINQFNFSQKGEIIFPFGGKLKGFGRNQNIRGIFWNSHRPDFIVLDDIENDLFMRSQLQREYLAQWVEKVVLYLGPPCGSLSVIYIGTIFHYDGVLKRLSNNRAWDSHIFQSIVVWPQFMNLWEQWEKIYRHDGSEKAMDFYSDHKIQLHQGAKISWPLKRSLLSLMILRLETGNQNFSTEMQNNPLDFSQRPFYKFFYWNDEEMEEKVKESLIYFGACDPSMGYKGRKGDPSATLIGGYRVSTGELYIVEADIAHWHPHTLIERILRYQTQYGCAKWFIETIQFQAFFKDQLEKSSLEQGVVLSAQGVKPHLDKILRIESLQPLIVTGQIKFLSHHTQLLEQLQHFPKGAHDDGPDCLEMLFRGAISHGKASQSSRIYTVRRR